MILLRSALLHALQFLTLVPYALLCLLRAPLPRPLRYRLTLGWPRLVIHAARRLVGIDWRVLGAEHLPDEAAIVLSKHQSTRETLFYPVWMPRELCYVFKRELLWLPFFGWGIGLLDMIHIDRRRGAPAFVLRPGTITVSIGPPIASIGRNAEALADEVESWIENEMRRISPHAYESGHAMTPAASLQR